MDVQLFYSEQEERRLFRSTAWRKTLDRIAFTITGHAVPYSGVDTGALTQSLSHRVEPGSDGALEAVLGSGAATETAEVWYAAPHFAGRKPTIPKPLQVLRRRKRAHPTKKAPTRPYASAMRALGIAFTVEEFES